MADFNSVLKSCLAEQFSNLGPLCFNKRFKLWFDSIIKFKNIFDMRVSAIPFTELTLLWFHLYNMPVVLSIMDPWITGWPCIRIHISMSIRNELNM